MNCPSLEIEWTVDYEYETNAVELGFDDESVLYEGVDEIQYDQQFTRLLFRDPVITNEVVFDSAGRFRFDTDVFFENEAVKAVQTENITDYERRYETSRVTDTRGIEVDYNKAHLHHGTVDDVSDWVRNALSDAKHVDLTRLWVNGDLYYEVDDNE